MKKKVLKIIGIIMIFLLIGQIFYLIDYKRAQDNLPPIFCFVDTGANDGGTIIYKGFGYKVIDYHTMDGYDAVHIGPWSMKYEDWVN